MAALCGALVVLGATVGSPQATAPTPGTRTSPAAAVAATPRPGASFDEVARKAAIAREANRLDQAIPLYHEALGLRPKWDEGWWYFATMLYDTDRFPEARDAFARFVALKPDADSGSNDLFRHQRRSR
jgi:tetratricopeptide (TPR) repeat protein